MANPEIVACGAYIRQSVANIYTSRGPHFGRSVASEYIVEIANVVGRVEGPDVAANIMFRATDAVLAKVPSQEIQGISVTQMIETATAPGNIIPEPDGAGTDVTWSYICGRIWARSKYAAAWWLVGILSARLVFQLVHRITGW